MFVESSSNIFEQFSGAANSVLFLVQVAKWQLLGIVGNGQHYKHSSLLQKIETDKKKCFMTLDVV